MFEKQESTLTLYSFVLFFFKALNNMWYYIIDLFFIICLTQWIVSIKI